MTEQEAKAIEFCGYATNGELESAYARASMHGNGKVCYILLKEMDRRSVDPVEALCLNT